MSRNVRGPVQLFAVFLLLFSALAAEPLQRLSGGEGADGLNLSDIRVGRHLEFTRIVFDVTYWQGYGKPQAGRPADKAGHYTFTLQPDLHIEAELAGFRSTTAVIPSLPKESIICSIKRLSGEEYGDDSAVFYRITLCTKNLTIFLL